MCSMIELIWTVFNYFKKASTPVLDCVQLFLIPLEFNDALILNVFNYFSHIYRRETVLLQSLWKKIGAMKTRNLMKDFIHKFGICKAILLHVFILFENLVTNWTLN